MSKAQQPRKSNLNREEISKRNEILKSIMEQKRAGTIDIKGTFELMYLNFFPLLYNRELVEDELTELKSMLDACADRMLAIIEKSRQKTRRRRKK
jgi:hypothetical protein